MVFWECILELFIYYNCYFDFFKEYYFKNIIMFYFIKYKLWCFVSFLNGCLICYEVEVSFWFVNFFYIFFKNDFFKECFEMVKD